jgi:proline racemase
MATYWVETEDWHTAGEPFRIVSKLPADCETKGSTVAERRANIMATAGHPLDTLRKVLCHEPRGHADMYGAFIVPPNDDGAVLGVLFWHKDGFSTACGHGTIALGCWALAHGLVGAPAGEGVVDVPIDVPSGRVVAQLAVKGGKVTHVDFINVPSFQLAKAVPVALPGHDGLSVDLSFGGAVYATLPASAVGLAVEKKYYDDFVRIGRAIKADLGTRGHYGTYDLYGVIFFDEVGHALGPGVVRQKNVTVFADGEIDRSPCGSGTAARVAVLLASGTLDTTMTLVHDSIVDTTFEATIMSVNATSPSKFPSCIPRVRGMANLTGRHSFFIDPSDPVYPGFVFR